MNDTERNASVFLTVLVAVAVSPLLAGLILVVAGPPSNALRAIGVVVGGVAFYVPAIFLLVNGLDLSG